MGLTVFRVFRCIFFCIFSMFCTVYFESKRYKNFKYSIRLGKKILPLVKATAWFALFKTNGLSRRRNHKIGATSVFFFCLMLCMQPSKYFFGNSKLTKWASSTSHPRIDRRCVSAYERTVHHHLETWLMADRGFYCVAHLVMTTKVYHNGVGCRYILRFFQTK